MSIGYHFMWNYMAVLKPGDNPRAISAIVPGGAGYGVRQWREESRRTTMVEAVAFYAQKIVSANAGIFFSNAVQGY
jgi:hypothetical protein